MRKVTPGTCSSGFFYLIHFKRQESSANFTGTERQSAKADTDQAEHQANDGSCFSTTGAEDSSSCDDQVNPTQYNAGYTQKQRDDGAGPSIACSAGCAFLGPPANAYTQKAHCSSCKGSGRSGGDALNRCWSLLGICLKKSF